VDDEGIGFRFSVEAREVLATDPEVRVRFLAPLNLMSTAEEQLERKSSGFGLKTDISAVRDPLPGLHDTPLSTKKLVLT
jgi:hypothetical protein